MSNIPLTTEQFIARAKEAHSGVYTYSNTVYTLARDKINITCPVHGDFCQVPFNHLNGAGCPQCAGRGVDWVARFRAAHGDIYDYSKVGYTDYKQKVLIICREHGEFLQSPDNHYRGSGCPQCKGGKIQRRKQMPVVEFITRAKKIHNNKFSYSPEQFSNLNTGIVTIGCPLHGPFQQTPGAHLAGKVGCGKCNNTKSKQEQKVADYMAIFTPVVQRDRTIIGPKELDVYLPDHKIAIEYCGMYWHAHKDPADEKKNKLNHYNKYMACKALGIRLITVYESEWEQRQPQIKRLLRNAIGKSKGRLMARKCEVRVVPTAEARAFYEVYHPQGGNGGGYHYGLYWKGVLVACMRFAFGNNDRGAGAKNQSWTLGRYATRVTVSGAASRLFKAFVDDKKPEEVKSFSDNRYFGGGMYSQLGFALEADVAPDYQVWSPKIGLQNKPYYQRRNLPKRVAEHNIDTTFDPTTDSRTELEMTYLMGCGRMYDCGKKRWVWKHLANPK